MDGKELILTGQSIYRGNLILVNGQHPIQEEMRSDCVPVNERETQILLHIRAAACLAGLLAEIGGTGKIVSVSGYRTREEQEEIYRDSMKENGEAFTRQYVALPDRSEHQTGLAIDLGLKKSVIDFIRPSFPRIGICGTFRKKAARYGFIERYPKGKEAVTGIAEEPWHFRYVGYPHSAIMAERGLCLEEYETFLERYPYEGEHLILEMPEEGCVEIFYAGARRSVIIPKDAVAEISGDNRSGRIVTLWRKTGRNQNAVSGAACRKRRKNA